MDPFYKDIFAYITSMEGQYRLSIQLPGNWHWSMKDHIELSYLYSHSRSLNKTDWTPIKNVTRPILNLEHRTEDIELKDVELYADDPDKYHLSFLVQKYHDDVFVKEMDLDTFFDELNVSRIDYGAGLSRMAQVPEVVPLHSIIFCDQTDILSGPIGIKHFFSPDQILEMSKRGWGERKNGATATLEEVIVLSRNSKQENQSDTLSTTPGKYIEVIEVHGNFPKRFLDETDDSGLYSRQIHFVCFYQKEDGKQGNITLYRQEEKENPFKLIKRDPVYGRALGFGGAEELFEPQVWVNYDMIRMQDMLDAASKTILWTDDPAVAQRNKVSDMENMEIVEGAPNTSLRQVDTFPRNLQLFEKSVNEWEAHAQQMGAANDALMGVSPAPATPFKLQELVTQEGRGLHEYRRQQYAKHIEEIYRDWIIPHIKKKIVQGAKFLSELSMDEMQFVTERVVNNMTNRRVTEMVLEGLEPSQEDIDTLREVVREEFKKAGNKRFIEILKGEFDDVSLDVKVSVAGKSKNLAQMTDKIVNIFRFAFSNPQGFAATMQIPGMGAAFNQILEYSGLSPVDFTGIDDLMEKQNEQMQQQSAPQQAVPSPMQPAALTS